MRGSTVLVYFLSVFTVILKRFLLQIYVTVLYGSDSRSNSDWNGSIRLS
jgi:hypothetical protein